MIEENSEDTDSPNEVLAQYIHENKRLKDELAKFKLDSSEVEENLNMLSVDIQKKDSSLKRSEQRLLSMLQVIQEKDVLIGVMEHKLDRTMNENKDLAGSFALLKDEKDKLQSENEILRKKEKELMGKQKEMEMKHCEFKTKIDCLSKENASNMLMLDDLCIRAKMLEEEKISLQETIEVLTETRANGIPSHTSPASFINGCSVNFSPVKRCLEISSEEHSHRYKLDNEISQLNLCEELLLGEINEKQNKINSLEEKLQSSENALLGISESVRERLKEAIDVILVLWGNANEDFEVIFPPLKSLFENLMDKLRDWLDGQSGENNPLTEAPDSTKVKEVVINAQPVLNRTVESISIATQTDRILLTKALEEFSPLQNVLDHKYSDVDMDLYRSYRKLSVLPEEEDDETFRRIPSLKNAINSKTFSAKLPQSYKTHSADDILNFENRIGAIPPSQKLISSCTNIILSGGGILNDSVGHSEFFQGSPKCGKKFGSEFAIICDNKSSDSCNFKSEQKSVVNSQDIHVASLDSVEILRQPHSFDSYLDPQQIQSTSLPRQISDPTQNTVCNLPLTRRGSYLKRPRSTCRPLRLPCEENNAKREERVSKVRFDLSSNANSKISDNINGSKGPMPASNLKNHKKIERISRFTVERVDEDEFRKSIDESSKIANHKRPPLIHSVVYKKSVLHEKTVYDYENNSAMLDGAASRISITGSPDSPSYETATENSPVDSFDIPNYESNYLIGDVYPCKRRKQSDSSSYSMESQDSVDGNDILIKSIKLHSNSEHITMKELDRESSTSSHLSMEMDIPYIDAEELPVIKPSPEITGVKESNDDYQQIENLVDDGTRDFLESSPLKIDSPIKQSESSETFVTACSDVTPTVDVPEGGLSPPKSSGLSKSPTVLKNLANFELYNTVSESLTGVNQNKKGCTSVRNQIVEEEEEGNDADEMEERIEKAEDDEEEEESTILRLTSSDVSEISDTVTYVTVKSDPSNLVLGSDCDSDTYVTIQSDKSTLERKFSDFSENSSSPYNTPPDTSSASFCTPPDTYSPILARLTKHFSSSFEMDTTRSRTTSSPSHKVLDHVGHNDRMVYPSNLSHNIAKCEMSPSVSPFSSPPCSPPFGRSSHPHYNQDFMPESESVTIYNIDDKNFPSERDDTCSTKDSIIFDSPKLEFYETNDSIENLEAFLKTEEGLQELVKTPIASDRTWRMSTLDDLQEEPGMEGNERKNSDAEEGTFREGLSKNNSFDGPVVGDSKMFEKRGKRHPPLSRQNSTEEYNFLEPHDSCLNLSEEISSPSTTPDTSNKTVIFKNKPLTVSNTIDLDDDDFPISESEIQINFNGSETDIVELAVGESSISNERYDIYSCRSEPCIPSISSSAELPTIVRLQKQSSSMSEDEPVELGKFDKNVLPIPPEIIVSNLSSESENDSDIPGGILIDFASNASERSEINLSDLNSLSAQSDNANSNSEPSDNLGSEHSGELQITDPEISLSVSPEVSENSSGSSPHPHSAELEMDLPDHPSTPETEAGISDETSDVQQLYVDIPENLTESGLGNLTVIDLTDGTSRACSYNTCEASNH